MRAMLKFLSQNSKSKKIIIFAILFLVVFVANVATPSIVSAVNGGPAMDGLKSSVKQAQEAYEDTKKDKPEEMGWTMDAVTYAAGYTMLATSYVPQKIGRLLLEWVMSRDFMGVSFTSVSGENANPVVSAGWPMVRDLANMFVVMGFVVIGIATILRFKDYEAKKLLPTLIIAALLINFSLVITGIFIDGSNIAVKHFSGTGNYTANSWSESLENQGDALKAEKTILGRTAAAAGIVFFNIMAAIVFLLFFFLMMARYIALWILVVLSPLAFVCYVFPFTKKIWSMWWSNFFGWCIVGIPAAFFLWSADKLTEGISKAIAAKDPGTYQTIPLADYMIPGILLIIGFLFSLKISAMGAGAAIGAFKWSGGKVMGAGAGLAKGGGKGLDKLTGGRLSSAGQAIKGRVGRTMERMNWLTGRKEGTTAMKEGAAIAEEQKRYEAMFKSGNASDKTRAREAARTGRGRNKAGAIAAAVATENINDIYKDPKTGVVNVEAMNRGLVHTEQFGAGESLRKNTTKQNPNIAAFNEPKVRENLEKMGYTGPIDKAPTKQRELAERQALAQAVQNTTPGDATKWDANVITPEVFAAMRTNQLIEIGKRGKPGAIEQVKRYKHDPTKPLSGQSSEWVKARLNIMKSGPAGSPERKATENQFANLQKQLATNDLFL